MNVSEQKEEFKRMKNSREYIEIRIISNKKYFSGLISLINQLHIYFRDLKR